MHNELCKMQDADETGIDDEAECKNKIKNK